MSLLTDAQGVQVADRLAQLVAAVRLVFYGQSLGCDTCEETRRLLDEVVSLDPRLSLEERNLVLDRDRAAAHGIDRAPGIVLERVTAAPLDAAEAETTGFGVRLLGAPLGYEFTALLDALLAVSQGDSGLSPASRERLATLASPVHIHVFSTPTCPHCPRAISLAHRIAIESPHVTATAVSAIEYPELIRRYRVTGVPKIVMNDHIELLGAYPEDQFVDAVMQAAAPAA